MLHHLLDRAAHRWPDRLAVADSGRTISYGELHRRAESIARGLSEEGVVRGDRVAIYLDNRIETVVAIFAALKAGAAFMMVNPTTKQQKLQQLLDNARASALVTCERGMTTLAGIDRLASLKAAVTLGERPAPLACGAQVVSWSDLSEAPALPKVEVGNDRDLAALLYTSGSTGAPKGVMLSHLNVETVVDSVSTYLELTADDVTFCVLPLSFGYGLTQLFPAMHVGARLVLEKGIVFPPVTLTRMVEQGATGFAMVPTMANLLLNLDLTRYDLSSLRYVTNAGAGLPPEIAKRFRQALPHVRLYLMYGQTECMRASYLDPQQVDARPDCVGRGMPNQETFVIDEAGAPVGPGEVGELVVRGPHVMNGYWELPEETERKLRPGRMAGEPMLYTGDLFRRDADGYLYFVGRQDDIIKSRGEKVSPREVENALYMLPGVAEAAVVGVPHPLLGQAVKAVVVLAEGASLDARAVQRHCAMHLEDFMVPSLVEFRTDLPKNERGKIVRRDLVASMAG